jgi:hypothetical protein
MKTTLSVNGKTVNVEVDDPSIGAEAEIGSFPAGEGACRPENQGPRVVNLLTALFAAPLWPLLSSEVTR